MRASPDHIEHRIDVMLHFYPNAPTVAAEWIGGMTAILLPYDVEAVNAATGPSGLAKVCKFLPTLAEAAEWLAERYETVAVIEAKTEPVKVPEFDTEPPTPEAQARADQAAEIIQRGRIRRNAREILSRPEFIAGDRVDYYGAERWNDAIEAGADEADARRVALSNGSR